MLLSVIIPVYNEEKTIKEIISRVRVVDLPNEINKEIIIVDDYSTDSTRQLLISLENDPDIKVIYKESNGGKGSALIAGFLAARGDFIVIQDADLEYDPADYSKMLIPLIADKADVVYGSRYLKGDSRRVLFFWHTMFNKLLTLFSNMLSNLHLTDEATCYKMFNRACLDGIKDKLTSQRFGIDPEITALVSKGNWRAWEVSASYVGRTWIDGKKINWKDGVAAFWHVIKFNLIK
ncbi:MAG: glycosyltransferase family 2 protein [Patescibacteria group bacterium]|nr:glycosyltransferase family 2 protein [Patescibacteria group bacterium]